jgi:hypothetical protein
MGDDDADRAQALRLLGALQDHIQHVTLLIEKAETRRRSASPLSDSERALRRDLYEAHGHVDRIHARFPETRTNLPVT